MIVVDNLTPGEYTVGTRTADGPVPFAQLWLWPATNISSHAGQWILELQRGNLDDTGLDEDGWAEMLGRLRLHPVSVSAPFLEKLRSDEPMAIIADTSALHSGAALQICMLRYGKPTLFAVPDQAYMEIHSQREHLVSGEGRNSRRVRTNLGMFMAVRHIRRLRSAGHVVHFARPPEAMVRYLGSDHGAGPGDEQTVLTNRSKAPSYVRDRLVIEATRALHRTTPHLPFYVLTADIKLALQSHLEQFPSGLCSVLKLPSSLRYGSPWFSPYTLKLCSLPIGELLSEFAWTLGSVYVQRKEETEATEWRLPEVSNDAARYLLGEIPLKSARFRANRIAVAIGDEGTDVPKRTPTAQSIVEAVIRLLNNPLKQSDYTDAVPFLLAIGWASRKDDSISATPAGETAARTWLSLSTSDVIGWCDWMDAASRLIQNVSTIREVLKIVGSRSGPTRDSDVAKKLGVSDETARKLLVFTSIFGLIIRLGGKLWLPADTSDAEAQVLEAVRRVAARSRGSAAPTERVFTDLLSHYPLTLQSFRRAIHALVERHLIERDRGTVRNPPKGTDENPVKLRTIIPDGKGGVAAIDVDLGHGDFLIPGSTMQDLVLRGEQS